MVCILEYLQNLYIVDHKHLQEENIIFNIKIYFSHFLRA